MAGRKKSTSPISVPQARLLNALKPRDGVKPCLTRMKLIKAVGFSPLSGTFSRAMNGVKRDSAVSEFLGAQPGLIKMEMIEVIEGKVDESSETAYRITKAGTDALEQFLAIKKLPKARDKALCVNARYEKKAKRKPAPEVARRQKAAKGGAAKAAKSKVEEAPVEVTVAA